MHSLQSITSSPLMPVLDETNSNQSIETNEEFTSNSIKLALENETIALITHAVRQPFWPKFAAWAHQQYFNIEDLKDASTSCTITATALSRIFFSRKISEQIVENLNMHSILQRSFRRENEANIKTVNFNDIFMGYYCFYSKNTILDSELMDSIYENHCLANCQNMLPAIDQCISGNFNYYGQELAFNQPVINLLRTEISEDCLIINSEQSKVYCFSVALPYFPKLSDGVEHAFILERFFCSHSQSIKTRLYQSWLKAASISDELDKRAYGKEGSGAWDEDQMTHFLDHLEVLYCQRDVGVSSKECFGWESLSDARPRYGFRKDPLAFAGFSLRYISAPISPGECTKNFTDAMYEYDQFKLTEQL